MHAGQRRIIFFLFVAIFFIATPLVVLMTLGYRLNFSTGRLLKGTALSVKSLPEGASIFLDGVPHPELTNAIMERAEIGPHLLEVKRAGFFPWQSNILLEESEAFFANVSLVSQMPPRLVTGQSSIFSGSQKGMIAYPTQQASWVEVWMQAPSSEPTLAFRAATKAASRAEISWSPSGDWLLLEVRQPDSYQAYAISADTSSTPVVLHESTAHLDDVWWNQSGADLLIGYDSSAGLIAINPADPAIRFVSKNAFSGFLTDSSWILTEPGLNTTTIVKQEGNNRSIVAELNQSNLRLTALIGLYAFLSSEDLQHHRLIQLQTGESDANWTGDRQLSDHNSELLIYADGPEINAIELKQQTIPPQTISRLSESITGLTLLKNNWGLFYSTPEKIVQINVQPSGPPVFQTIVEGKNIQNLWTSPNGRSLYFAGEVEGESGVWEKKIR